MTPTIASVRWVLELHRRTPALGNLRKCLPECVACDLLARLDDTQVIVTRDSLVAALWAADEAMVDEELGDRGYHDAMADLIYAALREAQR